MQQTGGNQPDIPHRAVAGFGLRPFSSGLLAIAEWAWPESRRWGASDVRHKQELVVILPDTGRNYLSKLYSESWLLQYGLMEARETIRIEDVLMAKSGSASRAPRWTPDGPTASRWSRRATGSRA